MVLGVVVCLHEQLVKRTATQHMEICHMKHYEIVMFYNDVQGMEHPNIQVNSPRQRWSALAGFAVDPGDGWPAVESLE